MNIAIWAITPNGIRLGERLLTQFDRAALFVSQKEARSLCMPDRDKVHLFSQLKQTIHDRFNGYDAHIFIFSTGIAVRMIAPLLVSKRKDPAVVVVDEKGFCAVSLVSGHLGGANQLTADVARAIGAVPVITTATDINHLPSIDMIAQAAGLFIETPGAIKCVNMKILKHQRLSVDDPLDLVLPRIPREFVGRPAQEGHNDIVCTWKTVKVSRETLILRPRCLCVGVGCNRGTGGEEMYKLIQRTFKQEGLSIHAIGALATTSVKNDEAGMLQLAKQLGVPFQFYENDKLNSVKTIENPSKMAEKYIGVKSVCEAAAILAANQGKLIVPKKKTRNVTMAVALKK